MRSSGSALAQLSRGNTTSPSMSAFMGFNSTVGGGRLTPTPTSSGVGSGFSASAAFAGPAGINFGSPGKDDYSLFYNNNTIVNDTSWVTRMTPQLGASLTIIILATLWVSFMLLESSITLLENIYRHVSLTTVIFLEYRPLDPLRSTGKIFSYKMVWPTIILSSNFSPLCLIGKAPGFKTIKLFCCNLCRWWCDIAQKGMDLLDY